MPRRRSALGLLPLVCLPLLLAGAALVLGGCSETLSSSDTRPAPLPKDAELQAMVDEVLAFTEQRHLNSRDHSAWQVVHGILAFGPDLKIHVDGELVSALDYLLQGGTLRGWNLRPGDKGLEAVLEAGSKTGQGHEDQWLGYLSQCGLQWDTPIVSGERTYKFGDLATQAQWDVYQGMEASWTLMGFSVLLPPPEQYQGDATTPVMPNWHASWTARDGSSWNMERLIAMEAAASLEEAPCGGSHRLGGIAMALNRHLAEGGELTGGWKAADDLVQDCVAKCRQFQQPDGSFSTNYWVRASTSPDAAQRMNATGHQLEFLCLALADEQLKEPWVTRAVVELCNLMTLTRDMPVECGGLYHAAHGLQIYRYRRFGASQ